MIMIFVIPKFKQIFKDFHVELPGVTKALLAISNGSSPRIWLGVRAFPRFFHADDQADPHERRRQISPSTWSS
jgi:type II secretory pathway component PulF